MPQKRYAESLRSVDLRGLIECEPLLVPPARGMDTVPAGAIKDPQASYCPTTGKDIRPLAHSRGDRNRALREAE